MKVRVVFLVENGVFVKLLMSAGGVSNQRNKSKFHNSQIGGNVQ